MPPPATPPDAPVASAPPPGRGPVAARSPGPAPAPDPAASPAGGGDDTQVLGALLVVFGAGWILRQSGLVDLSWPAIFSVVLIALGAGMIVTARHSRRSKGLIAAGLALTLVLASTSSLDAHGNLRGGDYRYTPARAADVEPAYRIGFGELTIDLSRVRDIDPATPLVVEGKVMVGRIVVLTPRGVGVRLDGKVGAGEVTAYGTRVRDGLGISEVREAQGYATDEQRVHLQLSVLIGSVDLREARSTGSAAARPGVDRTEGGAGGG